MELRPGCKQSEVGVIPTDWSAPQVGDLCDSIVPGRNKPKLFDGDIPWITTPDLEDGRPVSVSRLGLCISRAEAKQVGSKIVPPESVLMSCAGELGIIALTRGEIVVNQQLHAFIPTESIDSSYLMFALASQKNRIASYGTKTAVPYLNKKACNSIPIPLPATLHEQRAIASALCDVDLFLDALGRLIGKKRDIKQAAMQQLLTGQTRLNGFTREWEFKTLGELFDFSGGYSASRDQLSTEGHCYLHYGDIHGATKTFVDTAADYSTIPKLDLPLSKFSPKSLLQDGDVVFVDASEDDEGTSKHVVVVNKNNVPFISGLHTIVAKSKTDEINHEYRRYCFQTKAIRDQFRFYSAGMKVFGISKTNIPKLTMPVPSIDEQATIACVLTDMDSELEVLERRLAKTRELKQAMMQDLLTGRTRLL